MRARKSAGTNPNRRNGQRGFCPETVTRALVSAYEVRPAACSGYHSLSKERCEAEYCNSGSPTDGIPTLQALGYVASALDDGMKQALAAKDLSAVLIELHAAIAALIRNPKLIERCRSGREWVKDSRGAAE